MKSSTLRTHFIGLVMASLTTALMLGAIDRLAVQPEPGSVLAHTLTPLIAC